ncbi:MAG: YbhB/YbcL family Raf kinase inhibitor-like protein [Candidatus Methanoliparum thermophilum]|uniref:YbhB/YbcL family Raf kinase inhibitor-like protein n=1 Tax=Methanoliparum thermophilum TaxID=2491083 RepID=A0A520KQP5_METT2|nr:YbhB/YbcL family Raf kinase inhibitor-like protein [Candidatus Methanoliparum sp. LAM-1]RZN63895.1 MAG: YbhB/YbcL family Raf kinase inhibitor-like protein [Candidatus Methanoliparum thermophilum]BDC36374.1 hypothetical protein MTLP_10560 [Candidatus Methanoliparum sp. LAM-1]
MKEELILLSKAFKNGERIPERYTCDGLDISPPLKIKGPDEGTKSFALILDDPDAPMGVFDHWLIWNIDPKIREIEENVPKQENVLRGAVQGRNSARRIGYMGPCPPYGTHTYRFKLYTLDIKLDLNAGATKKDLEKKMEGHIIQHTLLRGTYSRR